MRKGNARVTTAKSIGHGTYTVRVKLGSHPLRSGIKVAPKYRIPTWLSHLPVSKAMDLMRQDGIEKYES